MNHNKCSPDLATYTCGSGGLASSDPIGTSCVNQHWHNEFFLSTRKWDKLLYPSYFLIWHKLQKCIRGQHHHHLQSRTQISLFFHKKKASLPSLHQETLCVNLWQNPYIPHLRPMNSYPLNPASKPAQREIHTPTRDITWQRRNWCQNPPVDTPIENQIESVQRDPLRGRHYIKLNIRLLEWQLLKLFWFNVTQGVGQSWSLGSKYLDKF